MATPNITGIKLKRKSRQLELCFDDGSSYLLSCELLRVHSPSAEVQGHGKPKLVCHKKNVNISAIEPVGNYAVKLVFDDGHNTGLYSWPLLYRLATQSERLWAEYLDLLKTEKGSREPLIDLAVKYS
ncbi:gamma-butyrobetaine hydroxylase-like domain-containing protein [Shewanella salipaludis]|uniref:DUF971 domain-containing protein n=1 Tax=Shewanella salipaludis TaxID=2723052 RepID=A0A972FTW1_9GAMM|nr:DUF971 domain-containing protein [Shewanella salipaludis]NMH65194.1 DUF971 domain-containing protein [Shewanella salipaludis]